MPSFPSMLDLAQAKLFELLALAQASPLKTAILAQSLIILYLIFRRPRALKVKGRTAKHVKAYKFKTKKS